MIVEVTIPAGHQAVRYGQALMAPAADRTLLVPAYVAKALQALPGVTAGPDLSGDTSLALLTAVEDEFEANYIFWANGRAVPDEDRIGSATTLFNDNGEPSAALV